MARLSALLMLVLAVLCAALMPAQARGCAWLRARARKPHARRNAQNERQSCLDAHAPRARARAVLRRCRPRALRISRAWRA
jgi:hypothetical protein